jgi:GT2 family glycosyltransferase
MIPIPTIAVLITCHNRKEKTVQCITALYAQAGLDESYNIDVFLVDDASTDGTSDAIKTNFLEVNIIQGNGNLYWNRGMHLAWKMASATKDFDYYLWLNDDTFLFEYAMLNLLKGAHLSHDNAAICGSTISLENKTISYGGNSKEGSLLIPNGILQETFSFNGNVVLVPKFVYDKVGILDPRFPHAIGDYEYALRIRKCGLNSFIATDYIGSCEGNDKLPSWCSTSIPVKKRIRSLYSPLGNSHPYYFFIFELKYYGLFTAIKHFVTIHLRILFPQLWLKKSN